MFLAVLGFNVLGVSSKAAVSVDGVVWIFASVSLLAMVKVKLSINIKHTAVWCQFYIFFPQRMYWMEWIFVAVQQYKTQSSLWMLVTHFFLLKTRQEHCRCW